MGGTVFTGLAVLVAALSLGTQMSALRAETVAQSQAREAEQARALEEQTRQNKIYSSKVRWWRSGQLVVQNGSSAPLSSVFFDTRLETDDGIHVIIFIGHIDPCTEISASWDDSAIADLAFRYSLPALWFIDPVGVWDLDEAQQLTASDSLVHELWPTPAQYRDPFWSQRKWISGPLKGMHVVPGQLCQLWSQSNVVRLLRCERVTGTRR